MEDTTIHDSDFKDAVENNNMIKEKPDEPSHKENNCDNIKRQRQSLSQKSSGMIHQVFEKVEEISDKITDFLPAWARLIGKMQEMTGYRKRYILMAMFSSPFILLLTTLSAPMLIPILMLISPIVMSVKAIEQKQEARTRWLIYWLFYNTITILEQFIGPVLYFIPGYSLCKNIFYIWCMLPMNENGCYFAYHLVRPFLMLPVRKVDEYIIDSMNKIETVVRENEGLAATVTLNAAAMAGNMLTTKSPKKVQ